MTRSIKEQVKAWWGKRIRLQRSALIRNDHSENGFSTALEVLQFFVEVDELGGSSIFIPHFTNGPARDYIESSCPSDIPQRDWRKMISGLQKSYAKAQAIDWD